MPIILLYLLFNLQSVTYSQGIALETSIQCHANIVNPRSPNEPIIKTCDFAPIQINNRPEIKYGCDQLYRTSAATGPLYILFYESGEGKQRKIISELYLWSSIPSEILEVGAEEDGFFYQLKSRFVFKGGTVATCSSGIKAHSGSKKKRKANRDRSDRGIIKEISKKQKKNVNTFESKTTPQ